MRIQQHEMGKSVSSYYKATQPIKDETGLSKAEIAPPATLVSVVKRVRTLTIIRDRDWKRNFPTWEYFLKKFLNFNFFLYNTIMKYNKQHGRIILQHLLPLIVEVTYEDGFKEQLPYDPVTDPEMIKEGCTSAVDLDPNGEIFGEWKNLN